MRVFNRAAVAQPQLPPKGGCCCGETRSRGTASIFTSSVKPRIGERCSISWGSVSMADVGRERNCGCIQSPAKDLTSTPSLYSQKLRSRAWSQQTVLDAAIAGADDIDAVECFSAPQLVVRPGMIFQADTVLSDFCNRETSALSPPLQGGSGGLGVPSCLLKECSEVSSDQSHADRFLESVSWPLPQCNRVDESCMPVPAMFPKDNEVCRSRDGFAVELLPSAALETQAVGGRRLLSSFRGSALWARRRWKNGKRSMLQALDMSNIQREFITTPKGAILSPSEPVSSRDDEQDGADAVDVTVPLAEASPCMLAASPRLQLFWL
eukprot:TRINITY_DN56154_c0_g1_i1.p1 TRINITY_DN56154_c0_g1~~TRINITY_DN56154_c0_g1_i1.p1  ORF type:complete len:323 (-),score=49.43 TRINITY_DN56154_c0_g1_i1:230-1198(-)